MLRSQRQLNEDGRKSGKKEKAQDQPFTDSMTFPSPAMGKISRLATQRGFHNQAAKEEKG